MKNIIKIILTIGLITNHYLLITINAQVGINEDNSTPNSSAILDVQSTTKGMLIPRMTTAERDLINSPATGLMIYNQTTNSFNFYNGTAWINITSRTITEIADTDNNTKIQVEKTPNSDTIQFDINGSERLKIHQNVSGQTIINLPNNNSNTFLGEGAGISTTTGISNIYLGSGAGYFRTTGNANIMIGNDAGENGSGNNNVYVGNNSVQTTVGSNNTFVGVFSGNSSTTSGSVFLGNSAGTSASGDNQLYIENSASNTPLIWGDFANDTIKIYGTLGVKDVYHFSIIDGTNGQVLKTNGNGNLTWQNETATIVTDTDNDTKIQVEKNTDEDIIRFDLAGTEAFRFQSNSNGVAQFISTSGSIVFGKNAGKNVTLIDTPSVYIGTAAGRINSFSSNVFVGNRVGENNNGSLNTFIGNHAGRNNTTGAGNTFIGDNTGQNSTGYNNVFLGRSAGINNTGSANVFLGTNAGFSETGSNRLYIENSASSTPLIWGDFGSDTVKIYGTLGIKDVYRFPIVDSTNGQVLKTDGAGNLSWQPSTSIGSLIQDADGNTQILVEPTANADSIQFQLGGSNRLTMKKNVHDVTLFEVQNTYNNTFFGGEAGVNTNPNVTPNIGHSNSFFGAKTGKNNTTGVQNSFFGLKAGENNTTGYFNLFMGSHAGWSNTTGHNNVMLGHSVGQANTTGIDNTFVGSIAGLENTTGYSNVFIGFSAGSNITTGGENTSIGNFAGSDNVTGTQNVYLGSYAGWTNLGNGNVFLGNRAGAYETGSNKLYIDNSDIDNPLIYGEFDNDVVQVNGTLTTVSATSARPLLIQHNKFGNGSYIEINNSAGTRALFGVDGSGFSGGDTTDVVLANWSNGDVVLYANATEHMRITAAGRVGIGRTATTNLLEVNGNASKTSAGSWVANSDKRLKKNITPLSSEKMLNDLLALQGITYEWNDTITGNNRPSGVQYGFTAQNIQEVFPALVEADNLGYLQTAYGTYDAMTVEAIRALNDKIERLESEKVEYQATLETLIQRIEQLEVNQTNNSYSED